MQNEVELRKLAEAATPGPWFVGNSSDSIGQNIYNISAVCVADTCKPLLGDDECKANARWIAVANPSAILELLNELESLRAEVESLRAIIKGCRCMGQQPNTNKAALSITQTDEGGK